MITWGGCSVVYGGIYLEGFFSGAFDMLLHDGDDMLRQFWDIKYI